MLPAVGLLAGARDALRAVAPSGGRDASHLEAHYVSDAGLPSPVLLSPWASSPAGALTYAELFDKEKPLDRSAAMSVPSIARARNIVATTLGRCELRAYNRAGDELTPTPTVLAQPDPAQARFVTMTWTVDDLIFHGVSWHLILSRLADGRPQHMRRIHPGGVELHDGGIITVYGQRVSPADVYRIDGPHEGILNYAARAVRAGLDLELSAARFAKNPVPAVELHQTDDYELTATERSALVAEWARARAGENGGVAYTSRNIEARVHGAPAEHLLTAGRNVAAIDAARVVGVPADAVDASPERASMTYANVETRGRTLIDYGLAAYAAAVEARFAMDDTLPAGTRARFDLSAITAPSASSPESPAPTTPEPA